MGSPLLSSSADAAQRTSGGRTRPPARAPPRTTAHACRCRGHAPAGAPRPARVSAAGANASASCATHPSTSTAARRVLGMVMRRWHGPSRHGPQARGVASGEGSGRGSGDRFAQPRPVPAPAAARIARPARRVAPPGCCDARAVLHCAHRATVAVALFERKARGGARAPTHAHARTRPRVLTGMHADRRLAYADRRLAGGACGAGGRGLWAGLPRRRRRPPPPICGRAAARRSGRGGGAMSAIPQAWSVTPERSSIQVLYTRATHRTHMLARPSPEHARAVGALRRFCTRAYAASSMRVRACMHIRAIMHSRMLLCAHATGANCS